MNKIQSFNNFISLPITKQQIDMKNEGCEHALISLN